MHDLFPQFPLYIPTKGRAQYMITSRALTDMGLPHYCVVEPQEIEAYQRAIAEMHLLATVLPLDLSYKDRYEYCDDLGLTKSSGAGPARNFIWDHSLASGYSHHWTMDDNIRCFYRRYKATRIKCVAPSFWRAMEDFCLRYDNMAMAGPNYSMFVPDSHYLVVTFNTRIYSCNLIRNDVPFRWRGRYNEDTILSLDMLKAGWCTVQFNALLQGKIATQKVRGGNTDELYQGSGERNEKGYAIGGTTAKSLMLARVHPDVAKVTYRFGRIHHQVDYRPFRKNILRRKPGLIIPDGPNEYGMMLCDQGEEGGA